MANFIATPFGPVHASWADTLAPVADQLAALDRLITKRVAARVEVSPARENVLRALRLPLDDVKVVVLGQDPYPRAGHSMGLAFSVQPDVRPLPPSLVNIFKELTDDTGVAEPANGDLSAWAKQGVLLLNRCLTVEVGNSGSHRRCAWEDVTDAVLQALASRGGPLVAVAWGNDARKALAQLQGIPRVESVHPSPLSARRGFFGSKPFSRCNTLLIEQGAEPVNWALPT